MRAVLDACVLYPSVLREILLGVAEGGGFAPIWSERLLEEWRRAAARNGGPLDLAQAEAEIALLTVRFPEAVTVPSEDAHLWLPDPADVHVLAAAIASEADTLVTLNLKDFPSRDLVGHGVRAVAPDAFLMELWLEMPSAVEAAVARTHGDAERMAGSDLPLRALLKRARLPRLGKALSV